MHDVFISYRRRGGAELARGIRDHLIASGFSPFFDISSMESGRYDKQLLKKIDECKHFILVLSVGALDKRNVKKDWVRLEAEYAIRKRKHIIIVREEGFSYPQKLPPILSVLTEIQEVLYNPEVFETHTKGRIVQYLCDENWSPIEYDDVAEEAKSRNLSLVFGAGAAALLCVALLIGLFVWRPWYEEHPETEEGTSTETAGDHTIPTLLVSRPTVSEDEVVYTVYCGDEERLESFELRPIDVTTVGFVADIAILGSGTARQIVLTDIRATGKTCYIILGEGIVKDTSGNLSKKVECPAFELP